MIRMQGKVKKHIVLNGHLRPWALAGALCVLIIVVIFGGYEFVERRWLQRASPELLHLLHLLRGVSATLIVATLVTWYLLKRGVPQFVGTLLEVQGWSEEQFFSCSAEAVEWLIMLRWFAFVILTAILIIGIFILNLVEESTCYLPLTVCNLLVGASNVVFVHFAKKPISPRRQIITQISTDLLLLTLLIHHSGGIENPLFFIYVFNAILASILLSRTDAYRVTIFACFLFTLVVLLELAHILPHYMLKIFPHELFEKHPAHVPVYVLGLSSVFVVIMFVVTYLSTSVAENLRAEMRKEQEMTLQLIQSAKMAAIGEMAGNIAHEINNPIGIIVLKVKNLLDDYQGQLPPKVISDLEKIDRQAERTAAIVRGLLNFARPSVEKKELLDIHQVLEESFKLTRARLESDHVQLKTEFANSLPRMKGNFNELQQVFINLINNAVDAMSQGGELRIRTMLKSFVGEDTSLHGVLIEVTDTGVGIPTEQMSRIFTPFFTTKGSKGTGLGLAICKGLVKSHGGEIWAESTVGKGSVFFVFLPAVTEV